MTYCTELFRGISVVPAVFLRCPRNACQLYWAIVFLICPVTDCQLLALTRIIISNFSSLLDRSCTNIMKSRLFQNAGKSRMVATTSRDPDRAACPRHPHCGSRGDSAVVRLPAAAGDSVHA